MSKKQLINKVISNKSKIENNKIRQNKLFSSQLMNIKNSISLIPKSFYINDSSYINCNLIEKSLRRFIRQKKKVDLIVIDYLQLLKPNQSNKNRNLVYEIGEITKQLKEIAKKYNCVVLLLSQLSRAVEERPNKRPILRDLRDSGNIEEDADVVLFCYREYYYESKKIPLYEERLERGNIDKSKFNELKSYIEYNQYGCELIVSKNRNDTTGNVKIHFIPKYSKITDVYSRNILTN